MPQTKVNWLNQLGSIPFVDANTAPYNAQGDGLTDDTAAIQAALDAASTISPSPQSPCAVILRRGKYMVSTALKFKHDGIILQGQGMMGISDTQNPAITDNICTILYAMSSHDATPVLQITPADCIDGIGNQGWYRGTCVRNVSFDVSNCPAFHTGSPPSVLFMRALSNCPEFQDITVYGAIGTAYDLGMYTAFGLVNENLIFENCYAYQGYNPNGGTLGLLPTGPAINILGADNIQFIGGLAGFLYSSQLPVNDNLTDVPCIHIAPAARVGGIGGIAPGSCCFERFAITNYVVSIRTSVVDFSGRNYGVAIARFHDCITENYNKFLQINQETAINTPGFWRSRIYLDGLLFSGAYGTNSHLLQGSKMLGGYLEFPYNQITGDVLLDDTTQGVIVVIGADPNGVGFFASCSDAGANNIYYSKTGLPGRILSGTTRLMGATDPATTISSPAGNIPLQCWGDTVKLWDAQRSGGANSNAVAGQQGDVIHWFDGATWWLAFCTQTGGVGAAGWVRAQFNPW